MTCLSPATKIKCVVAHDRSPLQLYGLVSGDNLPRAKGANVNKPILKFTCGLVKLNASIRRFLFRACVFLLAEIALVFIENG